MSRFKCTYLSCKFILIMAVLFFCGFTGSKLYSQSLGSGHSKFIGNVYGNSLGANFNSYWNQVTPENSGKWQYAEPTRDGYSWGGLDAAYNYALANGFPFKHHTLIWGQQYPSWITTLSKDEQAEEVEEWIRLVGERYPLMDFCDVVNEPLPGHAPAPYREAMGGAGKTGYDWVIWAFEKARKYMPNTKLILNEYNVINSDGNTNDLIKIVNLLKERNLIDCIGIQGHRFELESQSVTYMTNNLNKLAATGLPIYISEFDLGNVSNSGTPNDQTQLDLYKKVFPMLWEHPGVQGITFWGWIQSQIWQTSCYLVRSDGSERPAMQWLRTYLSSGNYQTKQSGNWNDINTWQWHNGTEWVSASNVPQVSGKVITIRKDHNITITVTDSADQISIASGGKLIVNSGVNFKIKNDDGIDLTVNGTIENQGTLTIEDSATIRVQNGGTYLHKQDGGSLPNAVWGNGSTCQIEGVISKAPSNGNQDFYNVVWNCPDQTGNYNMGWNGNTIGGNISILNTGTGRWQMCAPSSNSSATVTIKGNIIQTGGTFTTNGTGNAGTTITINHSGNINVTGGNFSISRGSQGGTGTTVWNLTNGNLSLSNAATQNSNPTGGKFIINGTALQTITLNNVTYGSGGLPIEVESGSILNFGTSVLRGGGGLTLKAGSSIQTAHAAGLDSTISNTGTRILSKEAAYIFSGNSSQVTGNILPDTVANFVLNGTEVTLSHSLVVNEKVDVKTGKLSLAGNTLYYGSIGTLEYSGKSAQTTSEIELPASNGPKNLKISNTSSVTLHASRIIPGALELAGKLRLGDNNITAASASSTGLTRYVITDGTGSLRLPAGNSEMLYPIGTATSYAPVWITNKGTADTVGVRLESDSSPTKEGGRVLVKWNVDETEKGGGNYSLKFGWVTLLENSNFRKDRNANARIFNLSDSIEAGSGEYAFQLDQQPYTVMRGNIETLGWFGVGLFGKVVGIHEEERYVPVEYHLSQNYPNPFNPSTVIGYRLPVSGNVTLRVYDILGREVLTLVDEYQSAGTYKIEFNGQKANNRQLTSGIYFYTLTADNFIQTRKMILTK